MTKRINKILWNGTEVPQAATRADGLDGLNLGELFIKNDPQEPGIYTRTTDGKVVLLGGGGSGTSELVDWNSIVNKPTKVSYFINDADYATTSDLDARIDALVNGAPQAYDTLKEIADVLANNINSIDDILTALGTKVSKDDFNTAIANVNTAIDSLNTELGLKLDAVTFNELFEKVQLEDGTWAIKAKLGLFSDGFISAKGSNVGGTSSEGGAVTLYQLNDVLANGTQVSGAQHGAVFVYDATIGKWKGVAQSEIVPNLTGYAKESWVLQQGFLTQHQDLSDYAKLTDIPTIPTTDINKGVTAYGWGDHSKVGYLTSASSLAWSKITGTPNTLSGYGITDWNIGFDVYNVNARYDAGYYGVVNGSNTPAANPYGSLLVMPYRQASGNTIPDYAAQIFLPNGDDGGYPNDMFFRTSLGSSWNAWQRVLTDNNYTSYTYSKSTIDTKLGGYLPLSGGRVNGRLTIGNYIGFDSFSDGKEYLLGQTSAGAPLQFYDGATWHTLIHSGNIGSQSVASATKLQTARTIWGQSFDGTGNVGGNLHLDNSKIYWHSDSANYYIDNYYDGTNSPLMRYMGYSGHRFMTSSGEVMRINSSGNVTIGGGDYAASLARLYVDGKIVGDSIRTHELRLGDSAENSSTFLNNWYYASIGYVYEDVAPSTLKPAIVFKTMFGTYAENSGEERMRITSNGNVGIGTTNPQYKLDVNGVIHSNTGIFSDGYVSAKGQNTSSDMRLKNVLGEVVLSVKDIANAPSMRFSWKNGGGVDVGSSAQYWQKLLPDAVKERDGMLEMQYANIALLSAIAIAKNVETHEERIARLEKENKELRNEINSLRYGA